MPLVCSLLLLVSVAGLLVGGRRRDFILGCPIAAAAVFFLQGSGGSVDCPSSGRSCSF